MVAELPVPVELVPLVVVVPDVELVAVDVVVPVQLVAAAVVVPDVE